MTTQSLSHRRLLLVQGKLDAENVEITNITDDRGVLVLAGPRSREVLS